MIFYNNVEFSSQPVIFITMMAFINMIHFPHNEEFHQQILKIMSLHQMMNLHHNGHHNDEISSK